MQAAFVVFGPRAQARERARTGSSCPLARAPSIVLVHGKDDVSGAVRTDTGDSQPRETIVAPTSEPASNELTATLARRLAEAAALSSVYALTWLVNRSYYDQFQIPPEAAGVSEADIAVRAILFFLVICVFSIFFFGLLVQVAIVVSTRITERKSRSTAPPGASDGAHQSVQPGIPTETEADAPERPELTGHDDNAGEGLPRYLFVLLVVSLVPMIVSFAVPYSFSRLFFPWVYVAPATAVALIFAAKDSQWVARDPGWRVVIIGWIGVITIVTTVIVASWVGRTTADHVKSGGDPSTAVVGSFSPLVGTTVCVAIEAVDAVSQDLDGTLALYLGQANGTTVLSRVANRRRVTTRVPSSSVRLEQQDFDGCR